MRVILIQNVNNLGTIGVEKEVKDVFARNFLFPKKLAVKIGDSQAKQVIEKAKHEKEKAEKKVEDLKNLAEKISKQTIIIKAKTSSSGKLFGAVTAEDVAKELKLDKTKVNMTSIKDLGEHEVEADLGHGIKTKVKIFIKAGNVKDKK